jgi:hypothetical protein
MPYVSSSGKQFRLDGPNRSKSLLRFKAVLVAVALLMAWLALGQQGSAIRAAEAARAKPVVPTFEPLDVGATAESAPPPAIEPPGSEHGGTGGNVSSAPPNTTHGVAS